MNKDTAPFCTVCGKVASRQDIDGDWWPPCEHASTHGISTLRYLDEMVVHCKRSRYDVYIGRGPCPVTGKSGTWGNPFTHLAGTLARYRVGNREQAIAAYREWFRAQPELVAAARAELRGKVLGCWCAPQSCHGHVLAEIANGETTPA